MPISDDTIRRVQETANIVEVVEEFLSLKKKGQNYWALSPFVNEKTPSFSVSPQKNIFKDFSSGKGGDSISFIMEMEGIGFLEAVKYLAKKYSIPVEETEQTSEQQEAQSYRESLLIAMNFAQEFFKEQLFNSEEGKTLGLSYFKERGFTQRTLESFGLGYSLNQWDGLKKEAITKGFKEEILEGNGLLIRNEEKNSTYDRFRGRVMFPVHNISGRVVAFGARTLKKDEKPKYINSPETEIYHKSDLLYGIFQAKNSIRNEDNCYLVEGYTDVISLHQEGITNVVASSGTSLTENQIQLIKRFTENITVLYDGDEAGLKASMRGVDLILEKGMNVRVVMFPDGQDPDSYVNQIGGAAFKEFLQKNSQDFILFKTQLRLKETEKDPLQRATVVREIIESISKIPDPIKREVFYQECSRLLDVDEQVLRDEGTKIQLKDQRQKKKQAEREANRQAVIEDPEVVEGVEQLLEEIGNTNHPVVPREFIFFKLLVLTGDKIREDNIYTCEFMINEIEGVRFKSQMALDLVTEYFEYVENGTFLKEEHFFHHKNESIKQVSINLFLEKGSLSDGWKQRGIYTPTPHDNLDKEILETVSYMKIFHLLELRSELVDSLSEEFENDTNFIFESIFEIDKELASIDADKKYRNAINHLNFHRNK